MDNFETKPVRNVNEGDMLEQPSSQRSPFLPPSNRNSGKWAAIKEFLITNKWYVGAISLGIAIIAVLAFFAFRPNEVTPQEANVQITIDAPQTAASGAEVIYKIKTENQDRANLIGVSLELVYPDGTSYVSSSPKAENISGTLFEVPDLSPGQNAVVIVKTTAQGNINDTKQLVARVHYHYSNFSSEFIKEATVAVRLVASDIALDLTGPQSTTNAQVVNYDLTYTNNSDHEISNARIQIDYPEGFSFADSNPKPSLAKNIWNIGTVQPGQSGKISLQGSFKSANPGQSQTLTANLLAQDTQGNYNTQATNTFTTSISSLPLVVTQSLDDDVVVAQPGDNLRYTLRYQNNATVAASGVNIVATIDPKSVDLSSIQAEGGQVNNNTITWNAAAVSNLERLNPNESGSLHFSVRVKNPAVKDSSKNITINTAVKIKSNEYQDFLPGNDLAIKLTSPSTLTGTAKYVSGQLPLKVGNNTTLQVSVSLYNSTNDFTNAVLTGFIPSGASFEQSSITAKEASSVTYDSSTGKLTWRLGVLAAHTGDFNPPRTLDFQVRLSPSSSQVGREITLFRNISFAATDNFVNQAISLTREDITTTDIPNGFSDGMVQP